MPILRPKMPISSDISPNNTSPSTAPKSLASIYKEVWELKLNKYKPSDKSFILANLLKEPTHELVRSFIKSVAEDAEAQFDKLSNPTPIKNQ
jgi:hypothetical protein